MRRHRLQQRHQLPARTRNAEEQAERAGFLVVWLAYIQAIGARIIAFTAYHAAQLKARRRQAALRSERAEYVLAWAALMERGRA